MPRAGSGLRPEVLVVDDDDTVLRAVRRFLSQHRPHWGVRTASSGDAALQALALQPVDVCVSDLQMAPMDGVALLGEVADRYPATIRVLYSAGVPPERAVESAQVAHQAFLKGSELIAMVDAVERALHAAAPIPDQTLWSLIAGDNALPAAPSVFPKLEAGARDPRKTARDLAQIIAHDPAVAARVLQLASSAFHGLPPHVRTLEGAISWLGLQTVRGLVLSVEVFRGFEGGAPSPMSPTQLAAHAFQVADLAARVARDTAADADLAFMAGVVHDLGVLVLGVRATDRYRQVLAHAEQAEVPLTHAERTLLGTTHAHVGAAILDLWGLDEALVAAVRSHHDAPPPPPATAAGALYVANRLMAEIDGHEPDELMAGGPEALGVGDAQLARWRQAAKHGGTP